MQKPSKTWGLFCLVLVMCQIPLFSPAIATQTIRVGVYQNIPLTFIEADGDVRGFFIDLLEHIAGKEDWQIEYVPDTWSQCLENLKQGKIDLLGVIAYSSQRSLIYDYTYESVLTEWGQVYLHPDSGIESILDFDQKKIAVLQADMHYSNLRELVGQFGIRCRFIEAFEYEDVLLLTEYGICDAGLVSQFYGLQYERDYDIHKSAIILSPQKLYWAATKDTHRKILYTLDLHLRNLKENEASIYYQALNKWFGVDTPTRLGKWVFWGAIGSVALVGLFLVVSLVLRAKVKSRTLELSAKNAALMAEIEHRKQAEEERSQLETRLQRAQKMEALGALAGGVAHDLNNILSGLVSYPELLLMDLPPDSPLRRPILTMKDSGEKAATVVQDLLTLARRGVAVIEVVQLNQIIKEYLRSPEFKHLKQSYPEIRFRNELEPDLLNVFGSRVHLFKTIMNLVSNGAESIVGHGEIKILTQNRYIDRPIRGYDDVEEGDYVCLSVSDTGVGISKQDIERIFEPFYTKKIMGRSGLGMAVVWGTVKDHQGYIDVWSTEGRGSTFNLYFPVAREAVVDKRNQPHLQDLQGCGESILVVDDIEQQRQIASDMLAKLGYSVSAVASGEEAIERIRQTPVDLLVLDMIMEPGLDGLETYRRIVAVRPDQRAVIASGFSENQRVKEAQRLGAGPYLKKPYTLEKFGLAVKEALGKAAAL
jgi:signal transduction histidine kinase/ActR/RegA family two-component response regulator